MPAATEYFTPDEIVERLRGRITKKTLSNWRSSEEMRGPPFCRFGNRILYPVEGFKAWEVTQQTGSTRDYGRKTPAAAAAA